MSTLDQYRIVSVSHINGKLWNVFYELANGSTDFETVKALDNQEAYHAAVKIITKKLNQG
jgi:hypothetical protein